MYIYSYPSPLPSSVDYTSSGSRLGALCDYHQAAPPHNIMTLLFTGWYYHKFHKQLQVAFRENIIVNSYASVALLQCYCTR